MSSMQQGFERVSDSPVGGCRFVVALKPEADPVIALFEMKPFHAKGPFRCWASEAGDHWLVVSGIGKTSAAAAVAWLHAISGADPAAAWINLGIAGHRTLEPGEIRRIHKITDAGTERSWYPPLVIGGKCGIESAGLITVDRPAKEFPDERNLIDMEASGFVEMAVRCATLELVHCLKIVSDNAETGFEDLKGNRGRISQLVSDLAGELNETGFFETLEDASAAEARRLGPPPGFDEMISAVHFTESQKHQLKRLLRRWAALGVDSVGVESGSDARTILRDLKSRVAQSSPPALSSSP